jgi:hypothetical protein
MVNLRTTVPFQAMIPGAVTSSSVLREKLQASTLTLYAAACYAPVCPAAEPLRA